ncbi:unnamed protein product [Adineta ricciae]|uniref:MULE transposase domain-containing protein n=1 Tax=Adineta ricciae TaxID=249248 RepID=A0A815WH03_ADIRI|nr:unnamed protein product [Adineta ricciae]
MQSKGKHNHLVQLEEIEVKLFQEALKVRVINETPPISKILYDEEMIKAHLSPETLANVPLVSSINSALNRTRRKRTPVLPTCCSFDIIPDLYQIHVCWRKVFILRCLATPSMFDQIFLVCMVFYQIEKKSTYQQLFKELTSIAALKNKLFQPERVVSDFEIGLILAVAAEFPQAIHQGCYFHYNQCINRRIQSLGLSPTYAVQELRQLFLYFQNHWMIDVPLQIWNFHDTPHRTNNISFHSRLNRRIQRSHSNIWSFINCLIGEECRFQHLYSQINAGTHQLPKAKAAETMQKRIETLNSRYNNQDMNSEQLLNALSLSAGRKK